MDVPWLLAVAIPSGALAIGEAVYEVRTARREGISLANHYNPFRRRARSSSCLMCSLHASKLFDRRTCLYQRPSPPKEEW